MGAENVIIRSLVEKSVLKTFTAKSLTVVSN